MTLQNSHGALKRPSWKAHSAVKHGPDDLQGRGTALRTMRCWPRPWLRWASRSTMWQQRTSQRVLTTLILTWCAVPGNALCGLDTAKARENWQGTARHCSVSSLPLYSACALTDDYLVDAVCFRRLHAPACAGEVFRLAPVVCGGLRLGQWDPSPAHCSAGIGRR